MSSQFASLKDMQAAVEEIIPPACELTKFEIEGPQAVLYLKNIRAFYEDHNLITKLAARIRKKVTLRCDSSVLMPPDQALAKIKTLIPPEAGISEIRFDPTFNEVVIEALKPGVVIGKAGMVLKSVILETGWNPRVLRSPTSPSEIVKAMRSSLLANGEERKKVLLNVGKKIMTGSAQCEWIKVTALGGYREVGRSCMLLQTPKSNIIIDCGLNVDSSDASRMYPYLSAMNLSLDQIDAVILTHAHLDHCLHPDTFVQLADGEIKKISEIKDGALVASTDFADLTMQKAVASAGNTAKDKMLHIRTNTSDIKATPEHRFFVLDELELREKKAHELKEGGYIASVDKVDFEGRQQELPQFSSPEFVKISEEGLRQLRQKRLELGKKMKQVAVDAGVSPYIYQYVESGKHGTSKENYDKILHALGLLQEQGYENATVEKSAELPRFTTPEFCQFIGYILGDGNPHYPVAETPCNDLAFTDKDLDNLAIYKELGEKVFKARGRYDLQTPGKDERNRVFFPSPVTRFLFATAPSILKRSRQRSVPNFIGKCTNVEVAAFLRGLYDAEGSVGHHSIVLVSSSKDIIDAVQMLLLRFGIHSGIEYRLNVAKSFGKTAYALQITHPQSIVEFSQQIGFGSKQKTAKLIALLLKIGRGVGEKLDLIPISGVALRQALEKLGMYSTDFNIEMSHYLTGGHYPSRLALRKIISTIEKYSEALENIDIRANPLSARQELRVAQLEVGKATGVSQTMVSHRELKGVYVERAIQFLEQIRLGRLAEVKIIISKLKALAYGNVLWAKIKSIVEIEPSEKVYDLSVPGYSNFVANGLIVHNSGFLPYLYAYGYDGPVYCTPPTRDLAVLLQQDCINVMNSEGKQCPYGEKEIKKELNHAITREYGEVTDVTPEIRFTFYNAGHILGSSQVHLHVGEGLHNLVATGDFKYGKTKLLDQADTRFPRVETLIMESTYGGAHDLQPRVEESAAKIARVVRQTMERRGKVLIPVFSVGRAQEIMLILEENFKEEDGITVYLDGMSKEASAIHTVYPEYLRHNIQRRILQNNSPFDQPLFSRVVPKNRKDIAESDDPCVILAPSGMLTGGTSVEFLKMISHDERNSLIFVGYQSATSLGRKVQLGAREVPIINEKNKLDTLPVNMQIETADGFSGHSDRSQLISYVRAIYPKPSNILTVHGDESKCDDLARSLQRIAHVDARAPMNLDTVRLR